VRIVGAWVLGLGLRTHRAPERGASDHTILVLGDSLSRTWNPAGAGWVALLGSDFRRRYGYQIVNASVSGETTSGGLERLRGRCSCTSREPSSSSWAPTTGCAGCRWTRPRESRAHGAPVTGGRRPGAAGRHAHPAQLRAALHRAIRAYVPELANQYHLPLVPFLLEKWPSIQLACNRTACTPTPGASHRFSRHSGRT